MGQYYLPVNLKKREYLYSHTFGDGLKLLEFGLSACGMMTGLALLLADGNGRGGGDLTREVHEPDSTDWKPQPWERIESQFKVGRPYRIIVPEIVGRWAGDPIVISGDYADKGKFVPKDLLKLRDPKTGEPVDDVCLYALCNFPEAGFRDISLDVLWAMWDDQSIRDEYDPVKQGKGKSRSSNEATLELMKLRKTPVEEWPLLIGKFKTNEVKNFYERIFRKVTNG